MYVLYTYPGGNFTQYLQVACIFYYDLIHEIKYEDFHCSVISALKKLQTLEEYFGFGVFILGIFNLQLTYLYYDSKCLNFVISFVILKNYTFVFVSLLNLKENLAKI